VTTLISVHNSEGCVGRCDAKCYEAQSAECDCICGGKNHGAGLEQARDNVAELAEGWLERWAEQQGLDPRGLTAAAQCDLFPHGSEPSTDEIRANLRRARRAAAQEARAVL
jgi:hypothetical protein